VRYNVPMADLKCVYYIYGAHRLLLKEALNRLKTSVGSDDAGLLDSCRFNAAEADVESIVAACQALSFLGGRRLVIVDNALSFNAAAQKHLAAYLADPNPRSILVLTQAVEAKTDKRRLTDSAVFKLCRSSDHAGVHEYELKSGTAGWVKARFAAAGKTIGRDAADYLTAWAGSDLHQLSTEVAKISAAAGDAAEINLDLVKSLAIITTEAEVFELIGAVVDRDAAKALCLLAPVLDNDSSGGTILSLIEREFRLIVKAKGLPGVDKAKLAAALGVSPGQAYYLQKRSRLFDLRAAKRALGLLIEADFARKSSAVPSRPLIEMLLVDLCALPRT
jgi:DNA polymerase III subunit delta